MVSAGVWSSSGKKRWTPFSMGIIDQKCLHNCPRYIPIWFFSAWEPWGDTTAVIESAASQPLHWRGRVYTKSQGKNRDRCIKRDQDWVKTRYYCMLLFYSWWLISICKKRHCRAPYMFSCTHCIHTSTYIFPIMWMMHWNHFIDLHISSCWICSAFMWLSVTMHAGR